jgi:hypothetical protein
MKTQLYFDLAGKTNHPRIHFRESKEVEEIMEDLRKENIAVFEIDGAALSSGAGPPFHSSQLARVPRP